VRRRERRELRRVRGHGDELALQMCRQLADHDVGVGELAGDVIAIGLALRGLLEIEELRVGRDLHADVAQARGPLRHRLELVERRIRARKLREKYRRAFHARTSSA